jgi:probable phosphoglycerate mutase
MVVAPIRTTTATLQRVPPSADLDRTAPAPNGPTRLLTLRHGESEWNAIGRWQGQEDPPLTDAGMLQAVAAAEHLGTFDAVWASTLQRAAYTAAIIAEALGIGPVQTDPELMENAFGPWEGLTVHEIEEGWPGYLADHRRPEGAEQPEEITARGLGALRRIAREHPGGEVLVVTHGGLMRTLRRALGGDELRFTNLAGCWFDVHPDGRVVAGDAVHLIDPQVYGDTL